MKHFLPAIVFSLLGLSTFAQTELLTDNSLEGSGWTSTSTNFGSVLCDANCGTCGGPCGPNTGSFYAWFGGAGGTGEVGTLSQNFNVASAGTAVLTFYLKLPIVPGTLGDSLIVSVDGNNIFVATPADSVLYQDAYSQVVLPLGNLSAGAHDINFWGEENEGGTFNQLVDDVSILIGSANVEEIILDEFITLSQNMMNSEVVVETEFPQAVDMTVVIYDPSGKQVYSHQMNGATNDKLSISTADFSAGTYMIDFRKKDTNPFSRSFTVVK